MAATVAIVVGADGLGKTPLVNLLCHLASVVRGIPTESRVTVKDPHKLAVGEAVQKAFEHVAQWKEEPDDKLLIYDRFPYPDEWIYGPLLRRQNTVWDWEEDFNFQRLEALMQEYGKVVYVYVGAGTLEDYLEYTEGRPDEYLDMTDKDTVHHVLSSYQYFFVNWSRLPMISVQAQHFSPELGSSILDAILNVTKDTELK